MRYSAIDESGEKKYFQAPDDLEARFVAHPNSTVIDETGRCIGPGLQHVATQIKEVANKIFFYAYDRGYMLSLDKIMGRLVHLQVYPKGEPQILNFIKTAGGYSELAHDRIV
jgi:hypothetical protein